MAFVDLDEKVIATYYDDRLEEWSHKMVTIQEVLDAVCDDYTVIEPQGKELETLLCSLPQAQDAAGQDYVQLLDVLETVHRYEAKLLSAQPKTCEGCKHLGKWENEVEYGYPSPCTGCKRRAWDSYER